MTLPADPTPTDFALAVLEDPRIAGNTANRTVQAFVTWEAAEGGNWKNGATCNPLNTTMPAPGSHAVNAVGVQAYPNWATGLEATIRTLVNGDYGGVLAALRGGCSCSGLAVAVGASPWGTGDFSADCAEISPPPPPPPPAPVPTVPLTVRELSVVNPYLVGGDVKAVQSILNSQAGAGLTVDGVFGPLTDGAVRRWQAYFGLELDGIVGPQTWWSLVAL